MLLLIGFTAGSRAATYGFGQGSDIDPANLPAGFAWTTNGLNADFLKMDVAKKIGVITILRYHANKDFLATSPKVEDGTGEKYPRMYFERDFTAAEKTDVTRYWDERMGANKENSGVSKISDDATVNQNCFNYAFVQSKCKGHWTRLIISPPKGVKFSSGYAIPSAIVAVTDPVSKTKAATNDLVIYTEPFGGAAANVSHASVVEIDGMTKYLKYRYRSSPVYKYKLPPVGELDTPMYYAGDEEDKTTWNWDPRAGGDGNKLWIGDKGTTEMIYRPK
jgi:hypothetical protein